MVNKCACQAVKSGSLPLNPAAPVQLAEEVAGWLFGGVRKPLYILVFQHIGVGSICSYRTRVTIT